jgi:hypothetical protein
VALLELMAVGTLAVGVGVIRAFQLYRRRQDEEERVKAALRSTVRTSIAKARDGVPLKIFGRARSAGHILRAPLSGRPCLVYDFHVERCRSDIWITAQRERDACELIVEDATGKAIVRATDAELQLDQDASASASFTEPPTGPYKEFLEGIGTGFGHDPVRVSEGVIEEGEFIAVLGIGHWERDSDPVPSRAPGYRGQARRFVLENHPQLKLRISDDPETV